MSIERIGVAIGAERIYQSDLARAKRDFKKFGTNMGRSMEKGSAMSVAAFARAAVGIYAVVKAVRILATVSRKTVTTAGELEEGWIGVAKTTGMAGVELEGMKNRIRRLSVEMKGVRIKELQDISKTAGQLGIRGSASIVEFTRVIGMIRVATDLTADEAAVSFAQIANVMDEPIDKLETLGSIMNELSNSTVATATDIADLTLRIGGAAKNIDMTTAEVMAISASLKDMGVRTEVGGTAVSQVLQKMLIDTERFAKVAGVELDKFTEAMNTKPMEAFNMVLDRMATLGKFGAARALSTLGLEGVRVGGVLLKLSAGTEVLRENLKKANDELEKSTSLSIEYETASQSLFAEATSVSNAFSILAEGIGERLLPAFKEILPVVQDTVLWMAKLTGIDIRTAEEKFADLNKELLKSQGIVRQLAPVMGTGFFTGEAASTAEYNLITQQKLIKEYAGEMDILAVKILGLDKARTDAAKKKVEESKKSLGVAIAAAAEEVRASEKAQAAINNVIDATARLGASKERLMALDVAAFQQQEVTTAQVLDFVRAKQALLDKENEIAAAKEAARIKEKAEPAVAAAAAGPGVLGAEGGEGVLQDALGPTVFGMNTRLEAMRQFHDGKIQMLVDQGRASTEIVAQAELGTTNMIAQQEQIRAQLRRNGLGMAAGFMGNLLTMTGNNSKKMFKMQQGFAIGQALIDGWASAVAAWKAGMSTGGPWAPVVAAAYTAMSLARTGAMIASIRAQKIGGSGSAGGAMPVTGFGGSGQPIPQRYARDTPPPVGRKIEINIYSATGDVPPETIDKIIEGIDTAAKDRNVKFDDEVVVRSA